jgi:lipopolysaccharide export system protein LptA
MNLSVLSRPALLGASLLATILVPLGAQEVQPTVIDSVQLEMHSTDTLTTFVFTKNVIVTGTNLKLTCDRLEVVTTRQGDPTATIGKLGRFKSLVAEGAVRIIQSDREAACGRAEVLPDDDKIILTDHPVVKDLANGATATGPRMVLYRGERRAVIEGAEDAPSRITLPAIKDLGFDPEPPKPAAPAAGEPKKS